MPHATNNRAAWIQSPASRCSIPPHGVPKPWRIVLLGAPGVGKGTQSQLLHERLGACHLSTGDIFRASRAGNPEKLSPAMTSAVECMRCGKLVPDGTVLDLIRERSQCLNCRGGFILDGFPRTVAQAQALEDLLDSQSVFLDAVVNLTVPLDQIVARLSGRRTCSTCKAVYHVITRPPLIENQCDTCKGQLFQREDDRVESIRVRMAAYEELTAPLAHFYEERRLLVNIDATAAPEAICSRAITALRSHRPAGGG
jgi:adenylate kinase